MSSRKTPNMVLFYLILRKITKFVAIRCQILRLKCTKFDFGWDSAQTPLGEIIQRSPDSLAGFKGPTSKGEKGEGMGNGREKRVKGGKERGREGGEEGGTRREGAPIEIKAPPNQDPKYATEWGNHRCKLLTYFYTFTGIISGFYTLACFGF